MRKAVLALVPVLAAAAAVGCGGSPQKLTESQEYFVGRGVAANAVLQTEGLLFNEDLETYVNLVGQTLALESDRPETFRGYHFAVLRSDLVNAFAAPGGFVFVTTGALQKMENEDELAGVLAHEIAHVNLRHPEDSANRLTQKSGIMDTLESGSHLGQTAGGAAIGALSYFGKREAAQVVQTAAQTLTVVVGVFGGVVDDILQEVMVNGYGRDAELKADGLAVEILCRPGVGYDPRALMAFISRLPKAERGAWSTHPALEGRLQAIEQEIKKRGKAPAVDPARTARFKAALVALKGQ